MDRAAEIHELLATRGAAMYGGEPVTQLEHALQSALLAQQRGAPTSLVVAALLHDLGHLLHALLEDCADRGLDSKHERIGAAWLARAGFPREVTEPIRLHVEAKRFLCATEPGYVARLSPASVQSLRLQGGAMSRGQAHAFLARPLAREAVELRRCDELAKVPGLVTPGLASYRELVARVL